VIKTTRQTDKNGKNYVKFKNASLWNDGKRPNYKHFIIPIFATYKFNLNLTKKDLLKNSYTVNFIC